MNVVIQTGMNFSFGTNSFVFDFGSFMRDYYPTISLSLFPSIFLDISNNIQILHVKSPDIPPIPLQTNSDRVPLWEQTKLSAGGSNKIVCHQPTFGQRPLGIVSSEFTMPNSKIMNNSSLNASGEKVTLPVPILINAPEEVVSSIPSKEKIEEDRALYDLCKIERRLRELIELDGKLKSEISLLENELQENQRKIRHLADV